MIRLGLLGASALALVAMTGCGFDGRQFQEGKDREALRGAVYGAAALTFRIDAEPLTGSDASVARRFGRFAHRVADDGVFVEDMRRSLLSQPATRIFERDLRLYLAELRRLAGAARNHEPAVERQAFAALAGDGARLRASAQGMSSSLTRED